MYYETFGKAIKTCLDKKEKVGRGELVNNE
jgi:hypothetical protein